MRKAKYTWGDKVKIINNCSRVEDIVCIIGINMSNETLPISYAVVSIINGNKSAWYNEDDVKEMIYEESY